MQILVAVHLFTHKLNYKSQMHKNSFFTHLQLDRLVIWTASICFLEAQVRSVIFTHSSFSWPQSVPVFKFLHLADLSPTVIILNQSCMLAVKLSALRVSFKFIMQFNTVKKKTFQWQSSNCDNVTIRCIFKPLWIHFNVSGLQFV